METTIRAAPSVDAHHHVNGPDTGRNFGKKGDKNNNNVCYSDSDIGHLSNLYWDCPLFRSCGPFYYSVNGILY